MASAVLSYANGAMGVVEASSSSRLPHGRGINTSITIEGDGGGVVLGPEGLVSVRSGEDEQSYTVEPRRYAWSTSRWTGVQDSVVETCRHWLEAVNGRVAFEVSLEQNLNTLAAVEACYVSAAADGSVADPAAILRQTLRQTLRQAGWV